MCNWYVYSLCKVVIVYVSKSGYISALWAAVLLLLVYLPGHPPYYQVAASIAAKTYSNAMMAVLNSRVKAASNEPMYGVPLWNESLKTAGINSTVNWPSALLASEP